MQGLMTQQDVEAEYPETPVEFDCSECGGKIRGTLSARLYGRDPFGPPDVESHWTTVENCACKWSEEELHFIAEHVLADRETIES